MMNNCNGNGKCDAGKGFCKCNEGWGLEDCSAKIETDVNAETFTLLPRQWKFLKVQVKDNQMMRFSNYTDELEVYVSYKELAIDTVSNYAGVQYDQSLRITKLATQSIVFNRN